MNLKTSYSKEEYAQLFKIPQKISDYINLEDFEEAEEILTDNPEYVEVNKYAVVVGNDLDSMDEEGNVTTPENVVDISDLIFVNLEDAY